MAQLLTRTPYHVHFEHVSCAKLRGKKAENVEKELVKILRILEEMQPSLLILDDFDVLASSPKEEASRQEEFLQFKYVHSPYHFCSDRKLVPRYFGNSKN